MELEIQKWGNSAAIRLNKALLQQLSSDIGGKFEAQVQDGGIFLRPVKEPEYTLEDLLASCTEENTKLEQEDIDWLNDKPKGEEIW
jgi:antitoxin component of MazEF toxin-antitoxin module